MCHVISCHVVLSLVSCVTSEDNSTIVSLVSCVFVISCRRQEQFNRVISVMSYHVALSMTYDPTAYDHRLLHGADGFYGDADFAGPIGGESDF